MSEIEPTGPDSVSLNRDTDFDIVASILEGVLEHRRNGARVLYAYVHDDQERDVARDDRMIDFPTLRMGKARPPNRERRIDDMAVVVILGTPFLERNQIRVSCKPIDWQGPE